MWTLIAPPIGQILNFSFGHKNPILWQVLRRKRTLKRKFVKFVIFLKCIIVKNTLPLFIFSNFFFFFWKCIMIIIILIYHFICKAHRNATIHRDKFAKKNTDYWVIDYYDVVYYHTRSNHESNSIFPWKSDKNCFHFDFTNWLLIIYCNNTPKSFATSKSKK